MGDTQNSHIQKIQWGGGGVNNNLYGIYYLVFGMVYIKYPLLLVEKSSPCIFCTGFPISLSGRLPYVRHCI